EPLPLIKYAVYVRDIGEAIMFKRFSIILLSLVLTSGAFAEELRRQQQSTSEPSHAKERAKELLTDAAIIALIIAGSIATYKAAGRPCACPDDTMRNGRRYGGNSAWSRPGGAKPLCFPTDITPAMISGYRASGLIPSLR